MLKHWILPGVAAEPPQGPAWGAPPKPLDTAGLCPNPWAAGKDWLGGKAGLCEKAVELDCCTENAALSCNRSSLGDDVGAGTGAVGSPNGSQFLAWAGWAAGTCTWVPDSLAFWLEEKWSVIRNLHVKPSYVLYINN